ncbi:MAG: ABC transporter permease [Thermoplasmatales archaeon]|nr:ABC transporter permease [Thermoplasmatales archaeon]
MANWFTEVGNVAWGDLMFMKHNLFRVLVSSLMSPLLYLLAFGYGLGGDVNMTYNGESIKYVTFVIPGIAALSSMNSSFSSTATRLNVQRLYYGCFDEMAMAPLRPTAIAVGKSMLGVIRGLLSCTIIFVIGFISKADLEVTVLLIVSILLSCFMFSALGVTAAMLAKSHQSMSVFNSLVILPMTFLCGTFFNLDSLPDVFHYILLAMPLSHSSLTIRASSLGAAFPVGSFVVMLAFAVIFQGINVFLLKTRRV